MCFAMNNALACLMMLALMMVQNVEGQDVLVLNSGETLEGEVQSVDPAGTVTFKFSQGTIPYPKNAIKELKLGERPDFREALKASEAGRYEDVIRLLQPLVNQYLGIPSAWVGQAGGELANALSQTGKTFESEQLSARIVQLYPDSPIRFLGPILKARTLLGRQRADEALAELKSIEDKLPVVLVPNSRESLLLGDYYFVLGMVMEQQSKPQESLEAYTKVAALYPEPTSRLREVEQKIENLKKSQPALLVP